MTKKTLTGKEDDEAFIARTREAREAKYATQKEICTLLDLDQGTYKQYETRTPLPRKYYRKFLAATGITYEWFLEGVGQGPIRHNLRKSA